MATDKPKRPTLRDVAREADVSVWTASNTFSNAAKVAPATRQRVLDAADALGYAGPNPGARTLALGRSSLLAFMSGGETEHLLSDPAAALLAQGALTVCSRAGMSLALTGAGDDHIVDGRILFRSRVGPVDRRPTVYVGNDGEDQNPGPRVVADLTSGVRQLAEYLIDRGHRRIAILSSPGDDDRLAAIGPHLAALGELPVLRTAGDSPWPRRGAGETSARFALRARPRPTALIALSDVLALGALEAAHALGLRVPEDLSVCGIDDTPGSDTAGLTSVFVPYRPMGELAAQLVIRLIDGERVDADPPPLPTSLTVRRSAGPLPAE